MVRTATPAVLRRRYDMYADFGNTDTPKEEYVLTADAFQPC